MLYGVTQCSGVGTIFWLGGGGHLTSNVATDFRVWDRINNLNTYTPPKKIVSSRFSVTLGCKHTDYIFFGDF